MFIIGLSGPLSDLETMRFICLCKRVFCPHSHFYRTQGQIYHCGRIPDHLRRFYDGPYLEYIRTILSWYYFTTIYANSGLYYYGYIYSGRYIYLMHSHIMRGNIYLVMIIYICVCIYAYMYMSICVYMLPITLYAARDPVAVSFGPDHKKRPVRDRKRAFVQSVLTV